MVREWLWTHTHTHTHTYTWLVSLFHSAYLCVCVCVFSLHRGTYLSSDLHLSASHLASTQPYQASLDTLTITFMHTDAPPDHLLGVALAGAIVGLACSTRSTAADDPTSTTPGSDGDVALLPVCVGVGLVRAVDMVRRRLWLVTPVGSEDLESVDCLLVGRHAAELPASLLQAAALGAAAPHLTLFGLGGATGAAAGAAGGKARRNVQRARLQTLN